jgi:Flp pilus assembly pilin Flp
MQLQRSYTRIGTILSLLGGTLVIYSVFFLPMVFGSGGGSFTPTSEWTVANTGAPAVPMGLVFLALLMISVLFVLVTSVSSFFRKLRPKIVTWRHIASVTGLIIQGPIGFSAGFLYAFGLQFGVGYWLALPGCIVMCVGTFLN